MIAFEAFLTGAGVTTRIGDDVVKKADGAQRKHADTKSYAGMGN